MIQMDHLEKDLLDYVQEQTKGAGSILTDTDLVTSGILDSLAIMGLIEFIENKCDLRFDSDELTPKNFNSVKEILRFISNRKCA